MKGASSLLIQDAADTEKDILVFPDLLKLAEVEAADESRPAAFLVRDVAKACLLHGRLSVIFLADSLDAKDHELLKSIGTVRVIKWNDDFGPEAFYGKADAEAARAEEFKKCEEEVRAFREQLEASQKPAETPVDAGEPAEEHEQPKEDNNVGRLILP
jgi:hypothetical protein